MGIHNPRIAAAAAQNWAPGVPVSIGGCAGWLHRGTANRAVLLVGAHGFEGLCSYQMWRSFASLIATRGPSALRMDLPGEGDSLDAPDGVEPIEHALNMIREAAIWLRQTTGVEDIDVACMRLGGLLAVNALRETAGISRLALLAPPTSGQTYVRELSAQARVLASLKPGTGVFADGINLCGFRTSQQSLERIRPLSYESPTALRMENAFVSCESEDQARTIATSLGSAGASAHTAPFEGYDDLMVGPTTSRTPWPLLDQAASWLAEGCTPVAPVAIAPSPTLIGDGFRETRLSFGPDRELTGVLCEPAGAVVGGAPVILANAGANNHTGWARMHVDFARRLARLGICSLRYDAYGIGDSTCERAGPRPFIYSERHRRDLGYAVDVFEGLGFAHCVAAGVCAGGFNAFHGVHGDKRIAQAILVNTLRFLWPSHLDLDVEERKIMQHTGAYASKATDSHQWKRVMTGEITPARAAKVAVLLARRLARKISGPLAAALGLDQGRGEDARTVRRMMSGAVARGAGIHLIYAENDPGREELARIFGREDRLLRRYPGLTLTIMTGSDHELTPEPAREALFGLIESAARRAN